MFSAQVGKPDIVGLGEGVKIDMNSSLVLNCTSCGGSPSPRIHWYHQDIKLPETYTSVNQDGDCTTGKLTFEDLYDVYDRDRISCTADNGFGNNASTDEIVRLNTGGL